MLMTIDRWQELERLRRLESTVRLVLNQKADDVCWRDVYTDMAALVGVKFDPGLLPRDQFMGNCSHFYDCLAAGEPYRAPPVEASAAESDAKTLRMMVSELLDNGRSDLAWLARDITERIEAREADTRRLDFVQSQMELGNRMLFEFDTRPYCGPGQAVENDSLREAIDAAMEFDADADAKAKGGDNA